MRNKRRDEAPNWWLADERDGREFRPGDVVRVTNRVGTTTRCIVVRPKHSPEGAYELRRHRGRNKWTKASVANVHAYTFQLVFRHPDPADAEDYNATWESFWLAGDHRRIKR